MSFTPYTNKDVQAGTDKQLFTVMSTFAGAGGSSTGYKLAGGKVLVSNEFVEHAYESYKLNNPNTEVLTGVNAIGDWINPSISITVFSNFLVISN